MVQKTVWPDAACFATLRPIRAGMNALCSPVHPVRPSCLGRFGTETPNGIRGFAHEARDGSRVTIVEPNGEGSPMKSPFVAMAFVGTLAVGFAWGQTEANAQVTGGTQSRS